MSMRLRTAVLAIAVAEAMVCLVFVLGQLTLQSDPAGEAMAAGFAGFAILLLAATTLPAFVLAIRGRALKTSLVLCLIPVLLVLWFFAAMNGWFDDGIA